MNLTSDQITHTESGITYEIIYKLNNWLVYYTSSNREKEIFIVHTHEKLVKPKTTATLMSWINDRTTCYCGEPIPENIIVLKAFHDGK